MKEAEPANVSESYTGVIKTKANAVQQDGALVVKKKKKKTTRLPTTIRWEM